MAGVWTLNWQGNKNAVLCGDWIEGISAIKDTNGTKIVSLSELVNNHGSAGNATWRALDSLDGASILLGSGNTAPAETDYALETPISGMNVLSVINEKPIWNTQTGTVSNTVKLTVQNDNAEAVTVREWGIALRYSAYNQFRALVYRAVLDSPVTIQPTQAATLTLTRSVTLTDPVVWPV